MKWGNDEEGGGEVLSGAEGSEAEVGFETDEVVVVEGGNVHTANLGTVAVEGGKEHVANLGTVVVGVVVEGGNEHTANLGIVVVCYIFEAVTCFNSLYFYLGVLSTNFPLLT